MIISLAADVLGGGFKLVWVLAISHRQTRKVNTSREQYRLFNV